MWQFFGLLVAAAVTATAGWLVSRQSTVDRLTKLTELRSSLRRPLVTKAINVELAKLEEELTNPGFKALLRTEHGKQLVAALAALALAVIALIFAWTVNQNTQNSTNELAEQLRNFEAASQQLREQTADAQIQNDLLRQLLAEEGVPIPPNLDVPFQPNGRSGG